MAFLKTSYRKGQYIARYTQTLTIASAAGYGAFSFSSLPRVTWPGAIKITPYSGDVGGITVFGWNQNGISFSGNAFNISMFYSGTSYASLAATISAVYLIEILYGSR